MFSLLELRASSGPDNHTSFCLTTGAPSIVVMFCLYLWFRSPQVFELVWGLYSDHAKNMFDLAIPMDTSYWNSHENPKR